MRSRRLSQALAELIVLVAIVFPALRTTAPAPAVFAALASLLIVTVAVVVAQREEAAWFGILPVSLGAFFGAALVSVTWTTTFTSTALGLAETYSFVLFGLYLALLRDAVQVVRAIGNASRVVIAASAGLELLNGAVLPEPVPLFNNVGSLAAGGGATGILGSTSALAFACLLALIAWWIEWRGHMSPSDTLAAWVALTLGLLALTGERTAATALVALIGVVAATSGLRRLEPRARLATQLLIAGAVSAAIAVGTSSSNSWLFAGSSARRSALWDAVRTVSESRLTLGWGWVGPWPVDSTAFPYSRLTAISPWSETRSAESAYLDVQLQLGVVGLTLLLAALGLAFVRGWLVASARRSPIHHWPVLAIALLAWWSLTSSVLVSGLGVLLFVAAAMSAARNRSWRRLVTSPRKAA